MVVDTSALIAILFREPEGETFEDLVLRDSATWISVVSRLEAAMVVEGRKGGSSGALHSAIQDLSLEILPFDRTQLTQAIYAFRRFGKGRRPAALNLGDCCSYGLAKALNEPLLFKGDDFTQTDISAVLTR